MTLTLAQVKDLEAEVEVALSQLSVAIDRAQVEGLVVMASVNEYEHIGPNKEIQIMTGVIVDVLVSPALVED